MTGTTRGTVGPTETIYRYFTIKEMEKMDFKDGILIIDTETTGLTGYRRDLFPIRRAS